MTDLNLSPKWEVNFGVGICGMTQATIDHLIVKMILGPAFRQGSRRGIEPAAIVECQVRRIDLHRHLILHRHRQQFGRDRS